VDIKDNINEIRADLNDIEWSETSFSWQKAHVASIFSKMAYMHIPGFELENNSRVNIIPCLGYQELIHNTETIDLGEILSSIDIGQFFMVERSSVVVVAIKVHKVIFISFRGTQNLYDWFTNLNISKSSPYPNKNNTAYFHKGFHRAVASCIEEVNSNIIKKFGSENTIYVTGHSLGGAMAAIFHALVNKKIGDCLFFDIKSTSILLGMDVHNNFLSSNACYTFGMPRFGNFAAMQHFNNPFHIYNKDDIVPCVPPKFLGYHDCLMEYCLTDNSQIDHSNVKGSSFMSYMSKLMTRKGIKDHNVEEYTNRINTMKKKS